MRNFNKKLLPDILHLAIPTMLEQLLHTAVQYVDTAMIGALGTAATAAVGATTTVNWLIGSTISALGVGFLAFISQALGAGHSHRARQAAGQAVGIVFLVGALFTLIPVMLANRIPVWMQVDASIRDTASRYFRILYLPMLFRAASIIFGTVLRAAGDTKTPMYIGFIVNFVNIVLNCILIFPVRIVRIFGHTYTLWGAGLGVEGAAIASAISYTVGGVVITIMLWRHKTISPRGQRIFPDFTILSPCLRVAFPNMLQRFATSLGYVVFAAMINALGDTATAAHTIANTVESLFYVPGYGMQAATATLTGNAWGAGDEHRLNSLSKTILTIEMICMTVTGGLLFLFAPFFVDLFSNDPAVIRLGSLVLRMVALSEPFFGASIVLEGMLQGLGRTLAPFAFNVTGMWCVRIIGTYVCTSVFSFGLAGAWGSMIAHNLLLCILFIWYVRSGRWKAVCK